MRHTLGDKFKYRPSGKSDFINFAGPNRTDRVSLLKYCRILSMFMDNITDSEQSPFGIHQIAEVGYQFKKQPGDWYGPQAISNVLKQLNNDIKPVPGFAMVVCNDGNVFLDKILKPIEEGQSVFVSIPVRLGLNTI